MIYLIHTCNVYQYICNPKSTTYVDKKNDKISKFRTRHNFADSLRMKCPAHVISNGTNRSQHPLAVVPAFNRIYCLWWLGIVQIFVNYICSTLTQCGIIGSIAKSAAYYQCGYWLRLKLSFPTIRCDIVSDTHRYFAEYIRHSFCLEMRKLVF